MLECREIVDSVKADMPPSVPLAVPVAVDKDGAICRECTELQMEFSKNPGGLPPRRAGLVVAGVVGGAALAVTTVCVPFLVPALRRVCLPFVPATPTQLANVRAALRGRSSQQLQQQRATLLDIGSGDGRIVVEAARDGFQVGYIHQIVQILGGLTIVSSNCVKTPV